MPSITVSGDDYMVHASDFSALGHGELVTNIPVVPSAFPTMKQYGEANQHWRPGTITWRVIPQVPTTVAGGYIAAFIPDINDLVDDPGQRLQLVTSTRNKQAKKWWESCTIKVPAYASWFYTSSGLEARFQSPGRFVVVADGQADMAGSLTITTQWTCSFATATVQEAVAPVPPTPSVSGETLLSSLAASATHTLAGGTEIRFVLSSTDGEDIIPVEELLGVPLLPDQKVIISKPVTGLKGGDSNTWQVFTAIRGETLAKPVFAVVDANGNLAEMEASFEDQPIEEGTTWMLQGAKRAPREKPLTLIQQAERSILTPHRLQKLMEALRV